MTITDLRATLVQRAIQAIQRRAERVLDETKLHDIYVDSGVLNELSIDTNQVIQGRRGVGKTHLLHFYGDSLAMEPTNVLYQVHDCTRLGSGFASDMSNPITVARNCFNQLLNDIATQSFDDLDRLNTQDALHTMRDPSAALLAFQDTATRGGDGGSQFNFRALGDTLDAFRESAGAEHFVIALDEFVAIRRDAQPYLAEFVKRAFFPKPRISFKIAAVSYLTQMHATIDGNVVGFEPAADTFADIDLDKYFVWEEDEPRAESFFGQVLYNHLAADLRLPMKVSPEQKRSDIIQTFFTQEKAFAEMCRASEGNCRDFLNAFRNAYFRFVRDEDAHRISIAHVKDGAEDWYRSEKLRAIVDEGKLEEFLNHLIQSVIRDRKTKTFMVHYKDVNHPLLNRLYAARLLHPLRTVWKHPDQPGEPYHLVTLDYGCFVALKNTASAPEEKLFFDVSSSEYDDLVPLDDRRSIRRVVVSRETLDRFI